jgi:hypothetical protein
MIQGAAKVSGLQRRDDSYVVSQRAYGDHLPRTQRRRRSQNSSSRDCLINRCGTLGRLRLVARKAPKRPLRACCGLSWNSEMGLLWNYQTVSPRTWVNRRNSQPFSGYPLP